MVGYQPADYEDGTFPKPHTQFRHAYFAERHNVRIHSARFDDSSEEDEAEELPFHTRRTGGPATLSHCQSDNCASIIARATNGTALM